MEMFVVSMEEVSDIVGGFLAEVFRFMEVV